MDHKINQQRREAKTCMTVTDRENGRTKIQRIPEVRELERVTWWKKWQSKNGTTETKFWWLQSI
jgi:hypothetical protein